MQQTSGAHALEYAGFWRRFAAFVIDVIIIYIVVRLLFPSRGFDFWDIRKTWYFMPLISISIIISTILTIAYSVVFWALRGQTPGMMVMNIKVLRGDGSFVSFGYALLRYLGYIICFLMLGVGFLWIAFDPRKQGIHDKIADTVVVRLPEPTRTQHAMASPRPG
jgi:uncharacterized RDD family membrane protein YckC